MLALAPATILWLCTQPTDMRLSFRGLIGLVNIHLLEKPHSGHYFVFINRKKTQMKVLYFEQSGYCLWTKKLLMGQFNYALDALAKQPLTPLQFHHLLEGVLVEKYRKYKRFSLASVGHK
jgi:transposase